MNQYWFLRITIISLFCAISLSALAMDFREGEYEITVTQGVRGLPGGMGSIKWNECLTSDRPIPTRYLQAKSCDVLESRTLYHTLHYNMSCFGENGTINNEGQIHFDNARLSGRSKSDMSSVNGEKLLARYKIKGRFIGDCQ